MDSADAANQGLPPPAITDRAIRKPGTASTTKTTDRARPRTSRTSFLNVARREKLVVAIRLLDGETLEGRIKNFDRFALVIDHGGTDHMVFKHAIATIKSPRSVASYYASHENH